MQTTDERYLELLSQRFPTKAEAAAELIRLTSELELPKGAEYFFSDVHGEYRAFAHILRNGSGSVRKLIDEALGDALSEQDARALATLVTYPYGKLEYALAHQADPDAWCASVLRHLAEVAKHAADALPLSVVDKMLSGPTAQAIDELIAEKGPAKEAYRDAIINTIVDTGEATSYIQDLCFLIQRLTVGHLHIIGDIFDRGPSPDAIMDLLMRYPSVDVQWGNHDIVWMGASLGQRGCIAHVVRNCARYGNLDILADAYGINILPLATFALETYRDDPCTAFGLKSDPGLSPFEAQMSIKIQKAMAIIQFKVEAALIDENPTFGLEGRKLLHRIDWEAGTVMVEGVEYELTDTHFPTVDHADPYALTPEEEAVVAHLEHAFTTSEKLQRHVRFLLESGSLYKICNNNLLLHACVPMNQDGSLEEVDVFGRRCSGKALFDTMQEWVYRAFTSLYPEERKRGRDLMWYMWLGEGSPLFAKSKMATFESYLVAEKSARKEDKNAFYKLFEDASSYDAVFDDFGLDRETAHIVCGHVPVKVKDGEDPVKVGGRIIYIDGGMSAAYRETTGIAGYTLVSDAHALTLYSHEPYPTKEEVVTKDADIHSHARVVERYDPPRRIADTDAGDDLRNQVADLLRLLDVYNS